MGASVNGYWPGITDEQLETQFGFDNDCKAWGDWMAERYSHPDVLSTLTSLGLTAFLSHIADGVDESEVDWVTPDNLIRAATKLREMVLADDPRIARVVETYAMSAANEDTRQELAQDLADVALIARQAKDNGIQKMTLQVNW